MTAPLRPQQHRLSWPLTPSQVEGLDTMLETLFKRLRAVDLAASSVQGTQGVQGVPGISSDDTEDTSLWGYPRPNVLLTEFTQGSVVFAGPSNRLAQNNSKFFWDDTNIRLGIGTAAPSYAVDVQATVDGTHRARVLNSSTGTGAFVDALLSCGTINAYIGASGQNYTGSVGGATDAKRSWLDTATVAGSGWDFSAPASDGSHRFYTAGYAATNERFRIATDVTIYNAAKLIQGGTALALGTTSTDGITTQNISAATVGTPVQISPRFRWSGTAWDTDDTVSRSVQFFSEVLGVSATTVSGQFKLGFIDPVSAAITYPFILSSAGTATLTGNVVALDFASNGPNGYNCNNAAYFYWATRAALSSPADGQVKVSNNAISSGVGFDVATDGTLKLRNRSFTAGTGNLDIGAKITAYNAVNTVGWGTPAIYGSGRSTGQTGDVASVATYTMGAADGSVLISSNINVTAFTAGVQSVKCDYTDETNTARTFVFTVSSLTGTLGTSVGATGPFEGFVARLRCKASTAITIKTVGTAWTGTYNVEGDIIQVS